MKRKSTLILQMLAILIIASMFIGACAPAVTPVPATQAPVDTKAPEVKNTEAPVATGGFTLNPDIAARMAAGKTPVIRVSYHDVSNEFAPQIKAGVEKAAADLGVDAVMVGPVGAKAEDQISELESLIEKGVDGIAISSVSTDALAPIIDKALAAGIPVVTYNTDNPGSKRLAFVGQDLVNSGRISGDLMAKALGEKGKVIITTLDASAQWSLDREKGAREALAKYPGISVVTTVNTGTEPQGIYSAIENAMLANQDVTGILSMECCSVGPAAEFVKRNNMKDKVKVVGFDLLPGTLQLVKEGIIYATIDQDPKKQGFEAVNLVLKALKGEAVADVDTGALTVDASNVDQFLTGSPAAGSGFVLNPDVAARMAAGTKPVIRISYHDVSNEFAPQIKAGIEKAAADLGVDAVMVGPVGAKAEDQIAELESLIEKGVDGIAISSVSTDALAPIIDKALADGIPVVTYNTDNPSSKRLGFVGQDLVNSGRIAGDLMAKALGEKGKVIITTLDASAQWSLDREKGAREALAKYPGITVVTTVNTGTEPQGIYSAIENAMLANQDVTGILSMECCSVGPAAEYVKRNNMKDKVKVVGFDLLPGTLQLVKEGIIYATIDQDPFKQGYEAVQLVYNILKGKPAASVDTGAKIIDLTNISEYLK
ncbi:MAG: sugar ABC transporter substrate-binding protein [Chloroflexi bacterium]|nr:sugar ABC transporter substrate-binding protein [Chloroflexota bacterium]